MEFLQSHKLRGWRETVDDGGRIVPEKALGFHGPRITDQMSDDNRVVVWIASDDVILMTGLSSVPKAEALRDKFWPDATVYRSHGEETVTTSPPKVARPAHVPKKRSKTSRKIKWP